MKRLSIPTVLVVLMIAPASANGTGELLGWGPFKFGMSFKEAKKSVGVDGIIKAGKIWTQVEIDGDEYEAIASFSGIGGKLDNILIRPYDLYKYKYNDDKCVEYYKTSISRIKNKYNISQYSLNGEYGIHHDIFKFENNSQIDVNSNNSTNKSNLNISMCVLDIMYEKISVSRKSDF